MKRWGNAVAVIALFIGGTSSAGAVPGPAYAGTGVVTGAVTYARPLTGPLGACLPNLPVEIRLSTPGFALKTPSGLRVVPLTVTAKGVAYCESESGGSARLHDVVIEAGGMRCELQGGYTRPSAWMTFIAASPGFCPVDEDGDGVAEAAAPRWSWLFNLAYTPGGGLAGSVVYQPY